jgi:Sec-independent protein secretion pathway component TatC
MGVMMVPLYGVFEISILIVWLLERRDAKSTSDPAAEQSAAE